MPQTAGEQPAPLAPPPSDLDDPGTVAPPESRLATVKATARARVADAHARIDGARERVPAVDVACSLQERDRRLSGNLLASALAYRMFLWLLPVLLVCVAILGFLREVDPDNPRETARSLGFSGYVASQIASASTQAERPRWILIGIGLVALYLASTAGIKALRAVHTLAWDLPPAKPRSIVVNAAGFVAFAVAALAATSAAAWLRERATTPGLMVTVGVIAIYGALWLGASLHLPHAPCPWTALVPGAVLAGVGTQALHLLTVYYLTARLHSSSQLYGVLGTAAAVLLWLFCIGRLFVGAALLNATMWERRCRSEAAASGGKAVT